MLNVAVVVSLGFLAARTSLPATVAPRSAVQMLKTGEKAPTFTLPDALSGKPVKVAPARSVIFFFPAADTPGCTKEAVAFSEQLKAFKGAKVYGVTGGNTDKVQSWVEANNIRGITLLADEGDEVRKLYNVPKAAFGLLPGRVTYVMDKSGTCVEAYDNLLDAESHVGKALAAL